MLFLFPVLKNLASLIMSQTFEGKGVIPFAINYAHHN